MPALRSICDFLQRITPLELAESWDNVGLLLGDTSSEIQRVMTCLTVTPASAAEAVAQQAQLIVSHHPVLFKPRQRITSETSEGLMLLSLLQAGVAVYSPHTAFDNCSGGINEILCRRLDLANVEPLRSFHEPAKCKIIVFVPEADLAPVSDAMFQAGAGVIGEYRQCSFRIAGTGTFFGSEATDPRVGRKGKREEVAEWRLEVVCPESAVASAVQAMRKSHSYEEPAFDVYPLKPQASGGAGRLGLLSKATPLDALADYVRTSLGTSSVQTIGDPKRAVQRIAVACGAGGEFVVDSIRRGADVLLTGEARFHTQLEAESQGLGLVLVGHYASERPGVEALADMLGREFPELHVWASRREKDPAWM